MPGFRRGVLHVSFYLDGSRVSAERFQGKGKSVVPGGREVSVCVCVCVLCMVCIMYGVL